MLEDTLSEMVDWSGDWATPWGSASQMRPWSASEAAHRTPPGKRSVGTEINPSFC
ncbi:hypothetical protein ACPCXF_21380 [Lysinibacillus agricola]